LCSLARVMAGMRNATATRSAMPIDHKLFLFCIWILPCKENFVMPDLAGRELAATISLTQKINTWNQKCQ